MCSDAAEVISDELKLPVIYHSTFSRPLPAAGLPAFTKAGYVHRLDTECTPRYVPAVPLVTG